MPLSTSLKLIIDYDSWMKGNEEEALTLTLQQNGDEIEERKMEESPLSGGTGDHPQPAVILVLDPSIQPQLVMIFI